jgi:signal transduction histidine kinase
VRKRLSSDPLSRYVPFALVALAGQVSAVWPPGPTDDGAYAASSLLLIASAVLVGVHHFRPPHVWLVRAAIYMSSVACLMLATGGADSGLGGLLLIPVVGVALYGKRWESAFVVVGVLAAMCVVSLVGPPHLAGSTPRRLFLTGAIAVMVSVAIHTLRAQLVRSNERTTKLLHHEEAINTAARQLVHLSEPPQITALGVQLAAQIASPQQPAQRRVAYFRIVEGMVLADAQNEDGTPRLVECWPLQEHPGLREAVQTLRPLSAPLRPAEAGPKLRAVLVESGITHGAWVPVCPDGALHGVLSISRVNAPIEEESVDRCVALGHFLELALSNWAAHEKLKQQATAEERRRIARELHDGVAHELAFIASKTRGCATHPGRADPNLKELAGAADRALDEARRAITVLSVTPPQSLDDAVAQTAEDMASRLGVAVDLDLEEGVEVPGEVRENLLRIVREAMTNAATHGAPQQVRVTLSRGAADGREAAAGHGVGPLRLVIEDDGCGFDLEGDLSPEGFGLQSMRERAESVGAALEVDSARRRGTRVAVAFG